MFLGINDAASNEDMQKVLESRSQERDVNDPDVQAQAKATGDAIAQKTSDDAAKAKGTTFKGPEGFSNVVGVGANPVMEAMTAQLEETRKQTALLEAIVNKGPGGVPVDYTKVTASSSPSRASLLSGK
jgi:carbamate kinase